MVSAQRAVIPHGPCWRDVAFWEMQGEHRPVPGLRVSRCTAGSWETPGLVHGYHIPSLRSDIQSVWSQGVGQQGLELTRSRAAVGVPMKFMKFGEGKFGAGYQQEVPFEHDLGFVDLCTTRV